MTKATISKFLYIPIKENKYLLDKHNRVRVYKTIEALKKYNEENTYDNVLIYQLYV